MIIKFTGEYTKEELIIGLEEVINRYVTDNLTAKGSFYLNFLDEEGEQVDYFDKKGESLVVRIENRNKKKNFSNEEIENIRRYIEEGKTTKEISILLKSKTKQVSEIKKELEDKKRYSSLEILTKSDFDKYMFSSPEEMKEECEEGIVRLVGLYKGKKNNIEYVYSIKDYCTETNLPFLGQKDKIEDHLDVSDIFLDIEKEIIYENKKLEVGLVLDEFRIKYVYDIEEVLKYNGLIFFDEDELEGKYAEKSDFKKIEEKYYLNKEIGYYWGFKLYGSGWGLIEVYDKEKVYEEAGYTFISEEEINEFYGKTLLGTHNVKSHFPKNYEIVNEFQPYGFDDKGREISKLKRPLFEKFSLAKEDIEEYILVDLTTIVKFKTLLKKEGIQLENLLPDAATEDNELAYQKSKIPLAVQQEYAFYLEKKILEKKHQNARKNK